MKRSSSLHRSIFVIAGAVALAANAHGATIVNTTIFTESIVYGTDTFETSGGAVLSTIQFVAWSDEIPSDIASQIAGDPTFLASAPTNSTYPLYDPAATAFIKSSASQVALATDLQFLSGQLPNVFLTSASGAVYVGSPSDVTTPEAFLDTLFPGFVAETPLVAYSLGSGSYNTGALDGPNTILEGTTTFNAFELQIDACQRDARAIDVCVGRLRLVRAHSCCAAQGRWRCAMKRSSFLYQSIFVVAGAVALGSNAHADTIVHTTTFVEDIVIETDTFETAGGAVLFTTNGLGYTDWLSPSIAADLAGDPAIPAQIQATVSLVTLASEYQFLAGPGPQYIVLGGVGPAIVNPYADQNITVDVDYALEAAGGPGYAIVGGDNPVHIVTVSYDTGAIEPDGSLLEGTASIFVLQESIVEQPATPEPSMFAMSGCGLFVLILVARRKAAGSVR